MCNIYLHLFYVLLDVAEKFEIFHNNGDGFFIVVWKALIDSMVSSSIFAIIFFLYVYCIKYI